MKLIREGRRGSGCTVVGLHCLAALGCGEASNVDQVTSPLILGTETSALPAVGYGVFPSGGPSAIKCTATLISPTTFVTAAHCINFFPRQIGGTITFPGVVADAFVKMIFSQGVGSSTTTSPSADSSIR